MGEMSIVIACFLAGFSQSQTAITTEQDYRETLQMLGISKIRMYAEGFNFNAPNAANRDESKAELYNNYPELLKFRNGAEVKTPKDWKRRRAELVKLFDHDIYGETPRNLPKVNWELISTTKIQNGPEKFTRRDFVGRVDNRRFPSIPVAIPMSLTLPDGIAKKVPVILSFVFARPQGSPGPRQQVAPLIAKWQQPIIAKGFGSAIIDPTAFQADNGAGLRTGIIGLMNKGGLRKKTDWGTLKAWGWGASRVLDYLETDEAVDAKNVAIEGLSRYGKAALVTMAYDERFAAAFVGSSGAGGAKLWRRDFGERETNLASSGEYHWMTPNFIRYSGPLTPGDMPVDQHQFIALCAPRAVFVGCGSPNVEGIWVDDTGMFKATAMASPVWDLLGKRGIRTTKMPLEEQGLTDGDLAFRQHAGGHTNDPNWPTFLDWFEKRIK